MARLDTPAGLAGLLAVAGTTHFLAPRPYESIVPPILRFRRTLVYVSGVAELACAAAVAFPASRRRGALASAGLFVAVFPANIYAARDTNRNWFVRVLAVLRLPLQVPLVVSALRVASAAGSPASE